MRTYAVPMQEMADKAGAFDFVLPGIDGRPLPLAQWRGSVLLAVNVASRCGFTPQYAGLEALWRRHRARGLVVIGCPCDQFGHQEPGDEAAIRGFCTLHYDVSFPMSARLDVNGADADPLWAWIKRRKRGVLGIGAIKWNFTKFLVGRDGQVLSRHAPATKPAALEADIERALARG